MELMVRVTAGGPKAHHPPSRSVTTSAASELVGTGASTRRIRRKRFYAGEWTKPGGAVNTFSSGTAADASSGRYCFDDTEQRVRAHAATVPLRERRELAHATGESGIGGLCREHGPRRPEPIATASAS